MIPLGAIGLAFAIVVGVIVLALVGVFHLLGKAAGRDE